MAVQICSKVLELLFLRGIINRGGETVCLDQAVQKGAARTRLAQGGETMLVSRHVDLHWELLKWLAILSLAIVTAMAFAGRVGGGLGIW